MDLELADKVVLITGASGGLGRELAIEFGRHDARVAVHFHQNADAADVVAQSVEAVGGEALTVQADLTDRAAVQAMIGEIVVEWGGVDILVNGAVSFESGVPIESIAPEQWYRMLDTVLTGAYHTTGLCAPYMRRRKWGRIVNLASRAGLVGSANRAHYTAAKAGLIGFTRALAKELGPDGILVNAVAPTRILTPKERERRSPEELDRIARQIPLGRIATPEDVARVVLFLGSGWNTYITGEVITVGGGINE
ncbi:MAG TPA: SDR family NAD(P)-dependent oxidoreductase [Anaerolineae bacterium]|nr:SDR family NAD(P)-dependent oxidoreductase [Anaerolineae bacterium]